MTELNNSLPDRSIGKKLKHARESNALSIEEVASYTKIRAEYIQAIESDNFAKFDSHVYAKGFIKNYATFLGLDYAPILALYRRDYENINKPTRKINNDEDVNTDKERKQIKLVNSNITKRKIAYALVTTSLVIIIIMLTIFLQSVFKPPLLRITSPELIQEEDFKSLNIDSKSVRISGETDPNTLIKVNDEPIPLKPGYVFETDFLPLTSERNIVIIEAQSPLGIRSKIRLEFIRSDLEEKETIIADAIIQVKEKPVFLLIRADGIIKFNDIAVPNEVINVTADKFIEVETSEPQYVSLQINEESYQLSKVFERFELGEKVLRLN